MSTNSFEEYPFDSMISRRNADEMANRSIDYDYVAYVDEAGDPGLKKVRPIDKDGTEWLILGCTVIRTRWEPYVPDWLQFTKKAIAVDPRGALHFRNLSPSRRLRAAQCFSMLPMRAFVVCSNKKNMRGWRNTRAEKIPSQEWFYNWCLRLLLERLTEFCERRSQIDYDGKPCKIKVEFSRRGGHRYSQTKAYTRYLRHQEQGNQLYLQKRYIRTDLLDTDLMEDHPHWSRPGLQIADTIASAFYAGANTIGPGTWDPEPAKALKRIMAKAGGTSADFGVALQPTPPAKANLTSEQQHIFREFGYDFERAVGPGPDF